MSDPFTNYFSVPTHTVDETTKVEEQHPADVHNSLYNKAVAEAKIALRKTVEAAGEVFDEAKVEINLMKRDEKKARNFVMKYVK